MKYHSSFSRISYLFLLPLILSFGLDAGAEFKPWMDVSSSIKKGQQLSLWGPALLKSKSFGGTKYKRTISYDKGTRTSVEQFLAHPTDPSCAMIRTEVDGPMPSAPNTRWLVDAEPRLKTGKTDQKVIITVTLNLRAGLKRGTLICQSTELALRELELMGIMFDDASRAAIIRQTGENSAPAVAVDPEINNGRL